MLVYIIYLFGWPWAYWTGPVFALLDFNIWARNEWSVRSLEDLMFVVCYLALLIIT